MATSKIKEGEKVIGVYMDDNSTVEVVAKGDIPYGHKINWWSYNAIYHVVWLI
ncbi:hypothetical protein V7149_23250 [Bacillus sp. JJ1503]|uniref:hypothetical protein n=1 Tax=unclassified Bacillus (in: firmicutes) TaxID=185979 RepID=UPI002FFFE753